MSTQGQTQIKESGFDAWWAKPSTKRAVGVIYSLGASIVIIGALFKILHWPGASVVLMVGMMTEAFLFAIGIADKPMPEYHWDHVFPSLTDKEANPVNISGNIGGGAPMGGMPMMAGGQGGGFVSNNAIDALTATGTISDEEAKKLTQSIKNMNETAAQLANISKVAGLTDSYASNLQKASEAAASFAEKQGNLDKATNSLLDSYKGIADNMSEAKDQTRSFADSASNLSKSLSSINTAYELQLKGVKSQAESIENMNDDLKKLQDVVRGAASNMDAYRQVTDQLARNIADLNNVYGNMLNAIKA
ncbi:MAG: gliding motility protein GldL [Paludibacteraceae bacterium]|nr:gliding motility protein GldL [Paludibacteraceae bacterium]